jgi:TRAP-type mannitol/chloroaromatic compound transport system permease large subunit
MSLACIVSIVVLVLVLLIGAPIPFAFMGAILSIVVIGGYDYSFLVPYGYTQAGTILLIAIPMFILAGSIMEKSGIG